MKRTISAAKLAVYVGVSRRKQGSLPQVSDYRVIASFRKDNEPDRLVAVEITPDMIVQFLAAMPTTVTNYVTEAAWAQADRTRSAVAPAIAVLDGKGTA
jgi:hypothetical protein